MRCRSWIAIWVGVALLGIGALQTSSAYGQGAWISSAGPVNRSMGGASVAAPLDALSAIYWNPASISGMERSQVAFGLDVLWSQQTIASQYGPFAGSTDSETGPLPIPNVAWTYKTGIPEITLGLGVNAVAGFKTNLPADPTNIPLSPPPFGLGQVNSQAQFLQIAPVISYAVTDRLSLAVGPTITTGHILLDPFVLASANADGTYSSGAASTYKWGGGVQVGAYYVANEAWRYGASFKSTTWMDSFDFYGEDENGLPRVMNADVDLPMVISVGTSYAGWEKWLLAMDVRYLDWGNTDGFGDPAVFAADGSLGGLDWSSIVAVALGVQRSLGEQWTLRGGYTYNQNPIKNSEAFFNIASPLIYEHTLSTGLSFAPNDTLSFNVAYSHLFANDRVGPLVAPGVGAIPGSSISNSMFANFLSFGLSVDY